MELPWRPFGHAGCIDKRLIRGLRGQGEVSVWPSAPPPWRQRRRMPATANLQCKVVFQRLMFDQRTTMGWMDQTKAAFSASATFIPLLLDMLHATVGALGCLPVAYHRHVDLEPHVSEKLKMIGRADHAIDIFRSHFESCFSLLPYKNQFVFFYFSIDAHWVSLPSPSCHVGRPSRKI